jgi:hypothetical protein
MCIKVETEHIWWNILIFTYDGTALRVPGGFESPRFQDNRHRQVVRLSALRNVRLYSQDIFQLLISARGWVDPRVTVRPEGLYQWKIPMTPSGIEPAAFRLVAQCLNRLRHRVSHKYRNVVFETDGEDQLDRLWQKLRIVTLIRGVNERPNDSKMKESWLYWSCLA